MRSLVSRSGTLLLQILFFSCCITYKLFGFVYNINFSIGCQDKNKTCNSIFILYICIYVFKKGVASDKLMKCYKKAQYGQPLHGNQIISIATTERTLAMHLIIVNR